MIGLFRNVYRLSKAKIPNISDVQKEWNEFSHKYNTFDLCPQTFFYSLVSILELRKARNILEVACGTGKMLPFAIDQKAVEASYLASDLAPNMV